MRTEKEETQSKFASANTPLDKIFFIFNCADESKLHPSLKENLKLEKNKNHIAIIYVNKKHFDFITKKIKDDYKFIYSISLEKININTKIILYGLSDTHNLALYADDDKTSYSASDVATLLRETCKNAIKKRVYTLPINTLPILL